MDSCVPHESRVSQSTVICTTFSPVNRRVVWNQCVAASLRQSFVDVHMTEMLPSRRWNSELFRIVLPLHMPYATVNILCEKVGACVHRRDSHIHVPQNQHSSAQVTQGLSTESVRATVLLLRDVGGLCLWQWAARVLRERAPPT